MRQGVIFLGVVIWGAAAVPGPAQATGDSQREMLLQHAGRMSAPEAPYRAEDYASLRPELAGKRLVLVGEPTHGMRECRLEEGKFVRFMVEEMGARTVVLELSYSLALELDGIVQGGAGDVRELLRVRNSAIWSTQSMAEMLEALVAFNRRSGTKVRVVGMDQETGGPGGVMLADRLEHWSKTAGRGDWTGLVATLRTGVSTGSAGEPGGPYDEALRTLRTRLAGLPGTPETRTLRYLARSIEDGREAARENAGPGGADAGKREREFHMSRVALEISAEEPATPTVVMTHALHLQRGRLPGDTVQSLGYHVALAMGDRAFFIGQEYGTGSMRAMSGGTPRVYREARLGYVAPGTIPEALGGDGPLLISLRDPGDGSAWSRWLERPEGFHPFHGSVYLEGDEKAQHQMVPADTYDALIYTPHVTPLRAIEER